MFILELYLLRLHHSLVVFYYAHLVRYGGWVRRWRLLFLGRNVADVAVLPSDFGLLRLCPIVKG